ncbi:hypothetical protein BDCR2A_01746 [Borrelia duttonii CR2A]|uniref:Uncharacterized protein n=1 Tax=Borrelia duttonii CR2A TaxID=1432657 RepID=W6TF70_9SPIR|nr:hypothetical protein BDCR2A_01746 [Borrelia duttonii CR2A]
MCMSYKLFLYKTYFFASTPLNKSYKVARKIIKKQGGERNEKRNKRGNDK